MTNTLISYIRNNKGEPKGVVVAVREGDEVFYGYSLCSPKDKWNKKQGVKIATARALARIYNLPKSSKSCEQIVDSVQRLSNRAVKYFKDVPKENIVFSVVNYDETEMVE